MSSNQTPWYAIRRKTAVAAAVLGVVAAAEIFIYGDIGESWYEETVSAAQFVRDLNALDVDQITIRINSIGGSVPDGLAIFNAIRRHRASITTEIDGMAFSIASLIAMAGDVVNMASNAMLMIHAPWTYTAGNSAQLRETADQLDTWAAAMSTSYAARTGDQPAMLALLTDGKDHYYTAAEAVAEKLVDAVTDPMPVAASAARDLPLNRYRSLPAALLAGGNPVAAATPSPEPSMPQTTTPTAANPTPATPVAAAPTPAAPAVPVAAGGAITPEAHAEVLRVEASRRQSVRASFAPFAAHPGVAELQRTCEDDASITPDAAGQRLLAHLGGQATPIAGGGITTVQDEADKRRGGVVAALLVRAGHASKEQIAAHSGNPYRGHTLLELARASLEAAGINARGMDKREVVAAAFTQSTSDFPVLLTDAIHRTLLSSYAVQALTWQRFCKRGTVSDFRAHNRFRVGSLGNLQAKNELGEYKSVAIPDGEKSTISAGTKGYIINLSREIVINDDLGAITDQAAAMGRAAARTVEADVYALINSNGGLGPVLADGKTLFHADHGNIGVAGAMSTTTFNEFRVLMGSQKDVSGNDYLDISPAVLLVPLGMEAGAKLLNQAQYEPSTGKNAYTPNISLGMFRDIVGTPRLTGTRYSAFADANEAPAIEVAFLDGNDTPFLEQESAFTTDGTSFKVRLDYGVAGHDYRGAATNAGA